MNSLVLAFAALMMSVAACSSSSPTVGVGINTMTIPAVVSGCSSSVTTADAKCTSCMKSNCASEIASFESACATYVSCESACGCATSCDCNLAPTSVQGGTASSACVTAESAFSTCSSMCDTQCSVVTSSGS